MKSDNPNHVTRQNFSLPPDLMKAILDATHALNQERSQQIVRARGRRVSYSKMVAVLAWLLKTEYLDARGKPTPHLHELLEAYERSRDKGHESGHGLKRVSRPRHPERTTNYLKRISTAWIPLESPTPIHKTP